MHPPEQNLFFSLQFRLCFHELVLCPVLSDLVFLIYSNRLQKLLPLLHYSVWHKCKVRLMISMIFFQRNPSCKKPLQKHATRLLHSSKARNKYKIIKDKKSCIELLISREQKIIFLLSTTMVAPHGGATVNPDKAINYWPDL